MSDFHGPFTFRSHLMAWHRSENDRFLPWAGEDDPYRIWLSEIILQQTRADRGAVYYRRLLDRYPTVHDLADAPLDRLLKDWEGLGYYNRARNLHATARRVAREMDGRFPATYDGLIDLRGVGPYTAAAIASFAFDEPHAVVDGNVVRVLSRYFGLDQRPDDAAGKRLYQTLAHDCLDRDDPGAYNQAIMDFGATVCTPAAPRCDACPLAASCTGFRTHRVDELPPPKPRARRRTRHFEYFVCHHGRDVFIRQRTDRDIWQGLYEFVRVEERLSADALVATACGLGGDLADSSEPFRQILSHQEVTARFHHVDLHHTDAVPRDMLAVPRPKIDTFAYPRIVIRYLTGIEYIRKDT